jgi:preprotein translocase subunit SecG
MNIAWFWIVTMIFALVAVAMILIILVQRPQGGGLVGAFGGASAGGTETVFGGRVGDALTYATVTTFVLFLGLAITLNLLDNAASAPPPQPVSLSAPANGAPANTTAPVPTPLPLGSMPPTGAPSTGGTPPKAGDSGAPP